MLVRTYKLPPLPPLGSIAMNKCFTSARRSYAFVIMASIQLRWKAATVIGSSD